MKIIIFTIVMFLISGSFLVYYAKKNEEQAKIAFQKFQERERENKPIPQGEIQEKSLPTQEPEKVEMEIKHTPKKVEQLPQGNEEILNIKKNLDRKDFVEKKIQKDLKVLKKKAPPGLAKDQGAELKTSIGTFYLQSRTRVIKPFEYKASMGKPLAKGSGYYLLKGKKESKDLFPLVVKRKGRNEYGVLTGVISIKTNSPQKAEEIQKKYQLKGVRNFPSLNLYIYKFTQQRDFNEITNTIKKDPKVERAELEILDKTLRTL